MDHFALHPRLSQDSFFVKDLDLCQLRLMNCSEVPWCILVPRINNLVNLTDLSASERHLLFAEIHYISQILHKIYEPHRINTAMIGNIVSQIHWHLVVRYQTDSFWPAPIWGKNFSPLHQGDAQDLIQKIQNELIE